MPHSENFPGGLWINGVRVDVAGRIAPKRAAQSKENCRIGIIWLNGSGHLSACMVPSMTKQSFLFSSRVWMHHFQRGRGT